MRTETGSMSLTESVAGVPVDRANAMRLRVGAIGSLGALTLLWLGRMEPLLFPVGTVLLTMSMVPLAASLRFQGGLLLGALFGLLWVASRLPFGGPITADHILTPSNVISVCAITALAVLAGLFFDPAKEATERRRRKRSAEPSDAAVYPVSIAQAIPDDDHVGHALMKFRQWRQDWAADGDPWPSFDAFVREVLGDLTGARRIRCYRVEVSGELEPLNGAASGRTTEVSCQTGLLHHVLVGGRRFYIGSASAGDMIRELASKDQAEYAWAVPIHGSNRICGLFTAGSFENEHVSEHRLTLAADLIEEFWNHLIQADRLRITSLIDRATGVLDRVQVLAVLDQTVEQCYANNEPVVMLSLVVEGIRGMDDGGKWEERDGVVETIGKTIANRLRRDDVIGRFSDDRFIAVLRRLDLPLAHLIAQKILRETADALTRSVPQMRLNLRAGLAGSGFDKVPPQKLMLDAFDAVSEARSQGLGILPLSAEAVPQDDEA